VKVIRIFTLTTCILAFVLAMCVANSTPVPAQTVDFTPTVWNYMPLVYGPLPPTPTIPPPTPTPVPTPKPACNAYAQSLGKVTSNDFTIKLWTTGEAWNVTIRVNIRSCSSSPYGYIKDYYASHITKANSPYYFFAANPRDCGAATAWVASYYCY